MGAHRRSRPEDTALSAEPVGLPRTCGRSARSERRRPSRSGRTRRWPPSRSPEGRKPRAVAKAAPVVPGTPSGRTAGHERDRSYPFERLHAQGWTSAMAGSLAAGGLAARPELLPSFVSVGFAIPPEWRLHRSCRRHEDVMARSASEVHGPPRWLHEYPACITAAPRKPGSASPRTRTRSGGHTPCSSDVWSRRCPRPFSGAAIPKE
jgi:hypothetical protein